VFHAVIIEKFYSDRPEDLEYTVRALLLLLELVSGADN
jgi:hypothetical protein